MEFSGGPPVLFPIGIKAHMGNTSLSVLENNQYLTCIESFEMQFDVANP